MQLLPAVQQVDRASHATDCMCRTGICAWLLDSLKLFRITVMQKQSFGMFAKHVRSKTRVEQQDRTAGGQQIWARKKRTAGGDDVWAYLQSQHRHKARQGRP